MTMYLKAKTNGIVQEYNELLAAHEDWKLITEQEAFPERFAPVDLAAREKKVDLTIDEASVTVSNVAPIELANQKGRLFSTADGAQVIKSKAKTAIVDAMGLKGEF